jgi:hypothetical protein
VCSERGRFLGELLPVECVCDYLPYNLSLSLDSLPWGGAQSQLGGDLLLS